MLTSDKWQLVECTRDLIWLRLDALSVGPHQSARDESNWQSTINFLPREIFRINNSRLILSLTLSFSPSIIHVVRSMNERAKRIKSLLSSDLMNEFNCQLTVIATQYLFGLSRSTAYFANDLWSLILVKIEFHSKANAQQQVQVSKCFTD